MDKLSQLKKNMDDMTELFTSKMTSFEESLGRGQPIDVQVLANEFYNFKSFILKAVSGLKLQMEMVLDTLDMLEMKSRNDAILLHGVAEKVDEMPVNDFVNLCEKKLHLPNITKHAISACMRLGKNISNKPRPLLVRFSELKIRNQVWAAKKLLKDSGMTISEFLTSSRHAVFLEARKALGVRGCWTNGDGKIVVVGAAGNRRRIVSMADLKEFMSDQKLTKGKEALSAPSTSEVVAMAPGSMEQPIHPLNKPRVAKLQAKQQRRV